VADVGDFSARATDLFRFRADDEAGPAVASLQATALHQGSLSVAGALRNTPRYAVVVKDPAPMLHFFAGESDSAPVSSIALNETVAVTHAGNGTDRFGFVLTADGGSGARLLSAFADAPEVQEKWVQAVINAGVLYAETPDAAVLSAKTVYEFTARDTFDAEVPLSSFAGKVLLIVNVASA
jgi:hypothetical protein